MEIIPFDWQRIFLGDQSPWYLGEIFFRTAFLYLYTILIMRFVGRRRSLGKLTPLEFILVIVLGPAAGGGMIYPDVPLFQAMAVITVLGVMARFGASLARHNKVVHRFFHGEPLLVIEGGQILREAIKKENLTEEDIHRELRQAGIESPESVRRAYFESSGQMSIFPYPKKDSPPE